MDADRAQISRIVEEVVRRVTAGGINTAVSAPMPGPRAADPQGGVLMRQDDAVAAAHESQRKWMGMTLEQRGECIAAMRRVSLSPPGMRKPLFPAAASSSSRPLLPFTSSRP